MILGNSKPRTSISISDSVHLLVLRFVYFPSHLFPTKFALPATHPSPTKFSMPTTDPFPTYPLQCSSVAWYEIWTVSLRWYRLFTLTCLCVNFLVLASKDSLQVQHESGGKNTQMWTNFLWHFSTFLIWNFWMPFEIQTCVLKHQHSGTFSSV